MKKSFVIKSKNLIFNKLITAVRGNDVDNTQKVSGLVECCSGERDPGGNRQRGFK
jgi:hypothetical protein